MAADPDLRAFVNALVNRARESLTAPPPEHRLEGRRLLGVSREVLRRVLLHAFTYRLTGQEEFRDRAKADLMAVAAFADWNPDHFLDVAEMATAVALGYDWLHHELTEEEKAELRRALVEKALNHGRNGHASFRSRNNWNQVCIGGLALAALAIGDVEPDLARSVLAAAHRNLDHGLEAYRPDGIYPEGPSYWEYGTSYTVLLVAALRSATGGDWGILKDPALRASAPWVVHMTGPSGRFYNFADGGARGGLMPSLFFFARELQQPALLRFQHAEARDFAAGGSARLAPLAAFWWLTSETPAQATLPRFWSGNGRQPVAVWRSSWEDPHALFFAIKAGGAAANHAHMDGGSFILEADGVRWAEDLGLQSYHSLESRGVQLWSMHQPPLTTPTPTAPKSTSLQSFYPGTPIKFDAGSTLPTAPSGSRTALKGRSPVLRSAGLWPPGPASRSQELRPHCAKTINNWGSSSAAHNLRSSISVRRQPRWMHPTPECGSWRRAPLRMLPAGQRSGCV